MKMLSANKPVNIKIGRRVGKIQGGGHCKVTHCKLSHCK